MLIQLDLRDSNRLAMEERVEQPAVGGFQNALGNHMLGLFQYLPGQYDLAEASFRISLARQRTDSVLE